MRVTADQRAKISIIKMMLWSLKGEIVQAEQLIKTS